MTKEKSQYNNIDLFKIIFAVIVVMIHSKPFMDISETVNWYFSNTIANLAVPFFFVTSGFLLFGKLAKSEEDCRDIAVKKYLLHILRMYLIWCVIWIPWKALNFYNIGSFTTIDLVKYIRDIIFVSGGDALWYLSALFSAVSIVYILRYKLKMSKTAILIPSLILYAAGCIISSWYGLFENKTLIDAYYSIFVSAQNGVLYGMAFVTMGMIIAESKKSLGIIFDAVGFVVLFIVLCLESYLINKAGLNKAGVCNNIILPATVFFMFRLILNIKINGNENVFRTFRDYSTIIYLCHCFIIRSIKVVVGALHISIPYTLLFVITLALSCTFAACLKGMSKKYNWCKLLY